MARPDGSHVTLVGGDLTDWNFSVHHPSWDPAGTRIAGAARWEVEPCVTKTRIVIFSNLWGAATRQALNSEEQIQAVFGPSSEYEVNEGGNGLAWSPDGAWIAYAALAVPPDTSHTEYMLVIAAAAGSGDIRILVRGVEESRPLHPTWSPDGQTIYFMRSVGSGHHIFSIPVSGGTETDSVSESQCGRQRCISFLLDPG